MAALLKQRLHKLKVEIQIFTLVIYTQPSSFLFQKNDLGCEYINEEGVGRGGEGERRREGEKEREMHK